MFAPRGRRRNFLLRQLERGTIPRTSHVGRTWTHRYISTTYLESFEKSRLTSTIKVRTHKFSEMWMKLVKFEKPELTICCCKSRWIWKSANFSLSLQICDFFFPWRTVGGRCIFFLQLKISCSCFKLQQSFSRHFVLFFFVSSITNYT